MSEEMSTQLFLIKVIWRFVSQDVFHRFSYVPSGPALRSDPLTANVRNTA
jgi:hypothetical protein